MQRLNPLAHYPKSFNQIFLAIFAVTMALFAYGAVDKWAEIQAALDALPEIELSTGFAVLLGLMLATGFGRIPLRYAPAILYGVAAAFAVLVISLTREGMPMAGNLTLASRDFGFLALVIAFPLPFLAWAYLSDSMPGIYGVAGGILGMATGTSIMGPAFAGAGFGMLATHFMLAKHGRGRSRERALAQQDSREAREHPLKRNPAQKARYTFADVDGMTELKETLLEAAREAGSGKPGARNGIMLFGPPGNGKSFITEALAGELGVPIIHVSFGSLASRWVNQSTEQMVALFADAAKQGRVVLFLDEIDALLVDRAKVQSADSEAAKTVSVFLAEVDKLRRYPVILVGATNHLDRLDSAAIREGRFDIKVEMTPPDLDARVGIFERGLRNKHKAGLSASSRATLRDTLARMDGFSVSRIRALTDEYGRRALNSGASPTYPTLLQCLRAIQGKSASEQERFAPLASLVLAPETSARLDTLVSLMADPVETQKLGGKVPRGVLLFGPPGTGKTTLAKAIAKETGWPLIQTSGHKLLHDPDEVRAVLDRARDLKPAIVFIDEVDDVLSERVYSGNAALTNELLTAMDGNSFGLTDVLFIGATNHPDALDSAAIRGGRLGYHVEVGLPGPDETRKLVLEWFSRKGLNPEAEGFDLDEFVRAKAGLSPADLLHHLDEWANARAARTLRDRGSFPR